MNTFSKSDNYTGFSMEEALEKARRERSVAFHNMISAALGFGIKRK